MRINAQKGVFGLLAAAVLACASQAVGPWPSTIDLGAASGSEGTPLFRAFGASSEAAPSDPLLRSMATGDFNGDGFDDLLIPSGRSAYIVYGVADTPASALALSSPDIVIVGGATQIRTLGDTLPFSCVAAGDINGDGYSDAIVGNKQYCFIVYGSAAKPGTASGLGSLVTVTDIGVASVAGETRLEPSFFDLISVSLATGDFDADGFDDLVVADQNSGMAFVIYGSATKPGNFNGAGTTMSLSYQGAFSGQTFFYNTSNVPYATAAGDIDGDGYDDLALGFSAANTAGGVDTGVVLLVQGTSSRFGVIQNNGGYFFDITASASMSVPTANGETRILGDDASDFMGNALAFGDLNSDGFSELIIGVPQGDSNALQNNGEVYILYGNATRAGVVSGAGRVLSFNTNDAISDAGETRILGTTTNAKLGLGLSTGDFNGDGFDELLISSPIEALPTRSGAGAIDLLYGSDALLGTPANTGSLRNLLDTPSDLRILGPAANSKLGLGLSGVGDFNRDGFADLVLGASTDPKASNSAFGSATVLYGGGDAESAMATLATKAGKTKSKGIDGALSPVLRAKLSFDDGDLGTSTMTLARDGAASLDFTEGTALAPSWSLAVNRNAWSSGKLTLQYTDTELGNADERRLGVWTAPSAEGPWTVPSQTRLSGSNTITADIVSDGYFVLAANLIAVMIEQAATQEDPTDQLPIVFDIHFDEPVQGLDMDDFLFVGDAVVIDAELTGSGQDFKIFIHELANDGHVDVLLPGGTIQTTSGETNAASTSLGNGVDYGGFPPIITLFGENPVTVDCPSNFIDPGLYAHDPLDGDVSVQTQFTDSDLADDSVSFTRTYTVSDSFGNVATAERVILLSKWGRPDITVRRQFVSGTTNVIVPCNTIYNELGADAVESCVNTFLPVEVDNPVDTSTPGVYFVTYTATSRTGRTAQETRIVRVRDTTAPTITLLGSSTMTIECGSAFIDPGATAVDACAGEISESITVIGQIDLSTAGDYTLEYSVQDPAGNTSATLTRLVTVTDTLATTFTLNGAALLTVSCGIPLVDPGASAFGPCFTDFSALVIRHGDPNIAEKGEYRVYYTLEDPAGNTNLRPVYRTFRVVDNLPPVITLNGEASQDIEWNTPFADGGATAQDACDGDLSANIAVSGAVDTTTVGSYPLKYTVSDSEGNKADERVRQVSVVDSIAPTVSLLGENPVIVACGSLFTDPGAAAVDLRDGDLTAQIAVQGAVQEGTPGDYSVTYSATDAAGNTATATRNVIVVDTTAPVIGFEGIEALACIEAPASGADFCFTAVVECGSDLSAARVISHDDCDGDAELLPIIETWVNALGGEAQFEYRYTLEDAQQNKITVDLQIIVRDSLPPSLTLLGATTVDWSCGITYFDTGFIADDTCDGNVKESTLINGLDTLDTESPGEYTLTFIATDAAGNETSATRLLRIAAPCRGPIHTTDINENTQIDLSELQRIIQLYNIKGYRCSAGETEDGFDPGDGPDHDCNPHNSDYAPQNWKIDFSELLRMIQFYQVAGYYLCGDSEDGYCPISN